jgi:hypothetical protein
MHGGIMEKTMAGEPLSIQDYLRASSDASSRTRAAMIAIAVASIVSFAAILHTMQGRWMHERILAASDIRSPYVARELGPYPVKIGSSDEIYAEQVKEYEGRYAALYGALVKTDIDNFIVSVPIIGFTFDVNDLDILGAVGFIAILTLYKFFLARELENLNLSFREAKSLGMPELQKFYTLLSMSQVFTVPKSSFKITSRFSSIIPKLVAWLPALILAIIEIDDLSTFSIGTSINNLHSWVAVISGTLGFIFSVILAIRVTFLRIEMDKVWRITWEDIEAWVAASDAKNE